MPLRIVALFGLGLVWMLLEDEASLASLVAGLVVGSAVLLVLGGGSAGRVPLPALGTALALLVVVPARALRSSVAVARAVVAPRRRVRPGIVAVPVDVRGEAGATVLAAMATLSPGTIALDLSADGRRLYVHALDASDPERVARSVTSGVEPRLLAILEAARTGARHG